MTEGSTLVKALADVRQRRAELQADYDRIDAELTKLRIAEKALAAIVVGAPLGPGALARGPESGETGESRAGGRQAGGRGSRGPRGPRSNSAKGRLKALLHEVGPRGLSQTEIAERLADVATGTLNTYLSMMVTSGEAARRGDLYIPGTTSGPGASATDGPGADDERGTDDGPDTDAGPRDETGECDAPVA